MKLYVLEVQFYQKKRPSKNGSVYNTLVSIIYLALPPLFLMFLSHAFSKKIKLNRAEKKGREEKLDFVSQIRSFLPILGNFSLQFGRIWGEFDAFWALWFLKRSNFLVFLR